jgi:hypothetical protein
MSNSLIKQFNIVYTLVPGGTTAYWHPEEVITKTTYFSRDAGGFQIVSVPIDSNGIVIDGFSFGAPLQAFDGYGNFLGYYVWFPNIITESVTTTTVIPGYYTYDIQPDRYEVSYSPNLGWNASALSIPSIMGNGVATFSIAVAVAGAVVGLNEISDSGGSDYFEITYGLYFAHGRLKVVESGIIKTNALTYDADDVFTISRTDTTVYYAKNDVVFYQSLLPSTAELVLDASLYAGGDSVYNAALVNEQTIVITGIAALSATAELQGAPKASSALTAVSSAGFNGGYSTDELHETATSAVVALSAVTFNGVYTQGSAVYASGALAASTEITVIKAFGTALLAAASNLRLGGGYATGVLKDLATAVLIAATVLASNGAYATGNDEHRSATLSADAILAIMQNVGSADCLSASTLVIGNYESSRLYDTANGSIVGASLLTQNGYYSTSSLHDNDTATLNALAGLVFNGVYTIDDAVYATSAPVAASELSVIKNFGSAGVAAQAVLLTTGNYVTGQLQDNAQSSLSGLSSLRLGGYGVGGYSDTGGSALTAIATAATNGAYTTGNDVHRIGSLTAGSTLTVLKAVGNATLVAAAQLQPPWAYSTGTLSEAGQGALTATSGLVFNGVYTLNQLQDSGSASVGALSALQLTGVYTIDNAVYSPGALLATSTLTNLKDFGGSESVAVADLQCTGIVGIGGLYDTAGSVLSSSAILTQNGYAIGSLTESGHASLTSGTALVFNGAYTNGNAEHRTGQLSVESALTAIKTFGSADLQTAGNLHFVGVYGLGGYVDSGAATLTSNATALHTGNYSTGNDVYSRVILTAVSDVNVIKRFADATISAVSVLVPHSYRIDNAVYARTVLESVAALAAGSGTQGNYLINQFATVGLSGLSALSCAAPHQGIYAVVAHAPLTHLAASADCVVVKAFADGAFSAQATVAAHYYTIDNDAHATAGLSAVSPLIIGSASEGINTVNSSASARLLADSLSSARYSTAGAVIAEVHAPAVKIASVANVTVIKAFGRTDCTASALLGQTGIYTTSNDVHAVLTVAGASALQVTGSHQGAAAVTTHGLGVSRADSMLGLFTDKITEGLYRIDSHAPLTPLTASATAVVIKAFSDGALSATTDLTAHHYRIDTDVHALTTLSGQSGLGVLDSRITQGVYGLEQHGGLALSGASVLSGSGVQGFLDGQSSVFTAPLAANAELRVIKAFAESALATNASLAAGGYSIDADVYVLPVTVTASAAMNSPVGVQGFIQIAQHSASALSAEALTATNDAQIAQGVLELITYALPQTLTAASISTVSVPHTGVIVTSQHVAALALPADGVLQVIKDFADSALTAYSVLSGSGHHVTEIYGQLAGLTALATDAHYAEIKASLPAMTAHAAIGELIVDFVYAAPVMSPMTATGHALSGGNTLDSVAALPAMTGFAADHNYAQLTGALSGLKVFGWSSTTALPTDYSGCAAIIGSGVNGSGTLLRPGNIILTAAHVVDGISSSEYPDLSIIFHSNLDIPRPQVIDIILHPGWLEDSNNDLALIVLKSVVPEGIERYDLYKNSSEVGQVFHRLGYSVPVNPQTGVSGGNAVWHDFDNRYEALIDEQNNVKNSLGHYVFPYKPPGSQLVFDYDDGTITRDVLGSLLSLHDVGILHEGGTRPGDSGAAAFIGGRIAGIAKSVYQVSPFDVNAAVGTYGEIGNDIRVSYYADWIESYTGEFNQSIVHAAHLSMSGFSIHAYGHGSAANSAALAMADFTGSGQGGGTADIALTTPAVNGAGTLAARGQAQLTLAAFTVSGTGRLLGSGRAALALMTPTVSGYGGGAASLTVDFTVSGAGVQAHHGSGALKMAGLSIAATGIRGATGAASLQMPAFSMGWGRIALTWPAFAINASGHAESELI